MVGDYMGTLGDECFLPPNPFCLNGRGEGVGLRDTLDEKREKGFSFFSTESTRVVLQVVTVRSITGSLQTGAAPSAARSGSSIYLTIASILGVESIISQIPS